MSLKKSPYPSSAPRVADIEEEARIVRAAINNMAGALKINLRLMKWLPTSPPLRHRDKKFLAKGLKGATAPLKRRDKKFLLKGLKGAKPLLDAVIRSFCKGI